MPAGVSALPQTSGTTKKEMDYSGWDPQLGVPVSESLVYTEESGAAVLNRTVQPNMGGTSAGTGMLAVGVFGYSGTSYRRIPVGTDDLLRTYTVSGGETVTLSADAVGNRVSAFQTDAASLMVSAKSNDAALMRVSAVGGTAGDNTLVDGSDQTVSAKLIQVSAAVSSNMNSLVTRMTSYDAANARVSALQSGTWSLTALLTDSTANVGVVSAKSPDAGTFHVSAYSGDAGQLLVSARLTDKYISATIDNGSVSAKSGDANQLHVSSVQGDAALLRVSALGGTAGDNIIVDGVDQTLSATIQRVSGSVSSGANALNVYAQNRDDASNLRVSARGSVSAFINEGTVSARQGTSPWIVSGTVDSQQVGTWSLSALLKEGSAFAGNVSATIKNYPLNVSGTVSAFLNQGTVSAIQPDANILHTSAVQGDAGLLHVSALGVTLATAQTLSATLKEGTAFVGQVSAAGGQLSATLREGTAFIGQTSAQLVANTVGTLSVYRTLNVSASQAVKATAGSIYGYFLANSDTKFNYIKFYNTSGAINVGTDTPILTIPIPPSAAANVEYPHGLIGFTNGIGIAALSAIADSATTASPASAVVANIFYK